MALTRKQLKDKDKSKAYAWVAYMYSHEPKEIQRLLKYGTPSDRLILLAESRVEITDSEGKSRRIFFPYSLNKSSGQKAVYNIAKDIAKYVKTIPVQAYAMLQEIRETVKVRRSDTQTNIHIVAEAVLHRAATEFKHEILFAFDSINEWIKAVYSKELGYHTIRKALELLEAQGFFKVIEWGVKGNRNRATKIEILASSRNYILTYTWNVDMWVDLATHGMTKVYARESTTRQDVLEAKFHHFADQMLEESQNKTWLPVRNLFGSSDVTLAEVEELDENGVWTDEYIDRLLGRLVPAMQGNGSHGGTSNRRTKGFSSFNQS